MYTDEIGYFRCRKRLHLHQYRRRIVNKCQGSRLAFHKKKLWKVVEQVGVAC
jgi:hypothetical protein